MKVFRPSNSMITFQNKKSFSFDRERLTDKTVSTVLVPAHLLEDLKKKTKEHGNSLVVYLRNLLWMYRIITHSGMIHPPRKIKTEYQNEGLNLKRVSFRVGNADWLELGELALAFGKSRCWLFTFLLELDLLGLCGTLSESGLSNAVPTKNKLRLQVSLSLRRASQDFARSYHVRV
ncbi:MAG: DUF1564 family protein [Leptospiraceae bacterium]|nr:DUF1564 family protein [Leptospiraceae bacterium]